MFDRIKIAAVLLVCFGTQGGVHGQALNERLKPVPGQKMILPDLIVSKFSVTGPNRYEDGRVVTPVRIIIQNIGNGALTSKTRFTVELKSKRVQVDESFVHVGFTRVGGDFSPVWVDGPMERNATRTIEGLVSNIVPERSAVSMVAIVDSCYPEDELADKKPFCRVLESDERNNQSAAVQISR